MLAEDIGLQGTETPDELDAKVDKMDLIQKIRRKSAYIIGLTKSEDEAPMNTPRIGIVTSAKDYVSLDGTKINSNEQDLTTRMFSMEKNP